MGRSRKQIAFDLSQEALRQHYPHKETAQDPQFFKRAYKDIQRFMDANGFERRQYSVYVSIEALTALDVAVLTQHLAEQLPWLRLCVKDITATNIGAQHTMGAPPQPSEAVAVGRGGRNGAGVVLAAGGDVAERNFFRRAALRRRTRRTPAACSEREVWDKRTAFEKRAAQIVPGAVKQWAGCYVLTPCPVFFIRQGCLR